MSAAIVALAFIGGIATTWYADHHSAFGLWWYGLGGTVCAVNFVSALLQQQWGWSAFWAFCVLGAYLGWRDSRRRRKRRRVLAALGNKARARDRRDAEASPRGSQAEAATGAPSPSAGSQSVITVDPLGVQCPRPACRADAGLPCRDFLGARRPHALRAKDARDVAANDDPALDEWFAKVGPCEFCGPPGMHQRHRAVDAIADELEAGEDPETVAEEHGVSLDAVVAVREWAERWAS